MHVLIVPSWYPTAGEPVSGVFFREQAHALARRGVQVGVIAPKLRSLRQFQVERIFSRSISEDDDGIPTHRWEGLAWFSRMPYANTALWRNAGKALFERYLVEQGMPDIIHAHSALNGGILAADLARDYRLPMVLTEHSSAFARNLLSRWQKRLATYAFRASRRLISVSPQLGNLLGRQYPETERRWEWIPNIVDGRFFEEVIPRKPERSRPFRVLNVALMTDNKGQRELITAFADAFEAEGEAELWLGGDGVSRRELESRVERLALGKQVKFLGMLNRDGVRRALAQCDALVLSSHYETFGVVLVEALAAGRPVIATRCGGPECIVRKQDGMLVPPGDIAALARAMRAMRNDIDTYEPETLRTECRSRFGEEAVVNQLKDIYHKVLQDASSAVQSHTPKAST